MSKSYTYHVVGFTADEAQLVCAMSKVEMAQQIHLLAKQGLSVTHWIAQTEVGCRILRCTAPHGAPTPTATIKLPKLGLCPICQDHGCPVCNWTGVCQAGHWLLWAPWQIEQMKKEYEYVR